MHPSKLFFKNPIPTNLTPAIIEDPVNPLDDFIDYMLSEIESTKRSNFKTNLLKSLGVMLALPAGAPFIKLAEQFAGKERAAYGYALAAGTVGCYANLAIFSYLGVIDELVRDYSPARMRLLGRTTNIVRFKWSASFILGALSCVPSMYLSYTYNDGNSIWPVINFLSSMGFRTFGFSTALDKTINFAMRSQQGAHQFNKNLATWCYYTPRSIARVRQTNLSLLDMKDLNLTKEAIRDFVFNLSDELRNTNSRNLLVSPKLTKASKFIGGLLPAAQIALNGILSYKASQLIDENPFFGIFVCAITLLPDTVIEVKAARSMIEDIIYTAYNTYNKDDFAKNARYFAPKLSILLYLLATCIAAFSYGASSFAIEDNFTRNESSALLPVFIMADISFHLYILYSNMGIACETAAKYRGVPEQKEMVAKVHFLQNVSQTLTMVPAIKINGIFSRPKPLLTPLEEGDALSPSVFTTENVLAP